MKELTQALLDDHSIVESYILSLCDAEIFDWDNCRATIKSLDITQLRVLQSLLIPEIAFMEEQSRLKLQEEKNGG